MRKPTETRAIVVAVTAFVVSALGGCGLLDSKHDVGECVQTNVSFDGTDIETVDCPADGTSFVDNITDPVYRINEVLDYEASCTNDGLFGIELKHEPDDAVYCLVPVV